MGKHIGRLEQEKRSLEIKLRGTLPGSSEEFEIRREISSLEKEIARLTAEGEAEEKQVEPSEGEIKADTPERTSPRKSPAFLMGFIGVVLLAGGFAAYLLLFGAKRTEPYRQGDVWTDPVTDMTFSWISGGCFIMGCEERDTSCNAYEKPAHEVCVDGFFMGTTEVTQGQWKSLKDENPSTLAAGSNHPVESVDYEDILDFIRTLNESSTEEGLFRLPTEAEWEYACLGGKKSGVSDGAMINGVASSHGIGSRHRPVDETAPNSIALRGMKGNVMEWCLDVYNPGAYGLHDRRNPVYTGSGGGNVVRGGSFLSTAAEHRCRYRTGFPPNTASPDLGFRLVRDLSGRSSP